MKPFGPVSVTSCFFEKGKYSWDEEKGGGADFGGFGGRGPSVTDPSSWTSYGLP